MSMDAAYIDKSTMAPCIDSSLICRELNDYLDSELADINLILLDIEERKSAEKLANGNTEALVLAQLKSKEIVLLAVEGLASNMNLTPINSNTV